MPPAGINQGNILMSQTNPIAMGGGQITQNVVPTNNQQNCPPNAGPQGQMNVQVSFILFRVFFFLDKTIDLNTETAT